MIRALEKVGLKPDVIIGTSIGAVVGGCHAAGKLDALEAFARSLTKSRVLWLMDFHIGSGLISGERLKKLLDQEVGDASIEELETRFAAVATELRTGHEIWLTRGPLVRALQASYALPGIFDPVHLGGRWLFDGALVNPIPVTTTRAMSAELVIAVNLNNDLFGRGAVIPDHGDQPPQEEMAETIAEGLFSPMLGAARSFTQRIRRSPVPALQASWSTPSTSRRTASRDPAWPAIRRTSTSSPGSARSACSISTARRKSSGSAKNPWPTPWKTSRSPWMP